MKHSATYRQPSPCLSCTRVADPENCENKRCQSWRQWFLARWEQLRSGPWEAMEHTKPEPVGVELGGRVYAAPHQVRAYLDRDPCKECKCPRDLCTEPCRVRRAWEKARKEVLL